MVETPEEMFRFGGSIGRSLKGGEVLLLQGGLGAGKTLLTKGIVAELGFDEDEVSSPSFSLVNLYRTEMFDVYHIDLWRIDEGSNAGFGVGLPEILEDEKAAVIIEWPERLGNFAFGRPVRRIFIEGDGDLARKITIKDETG